MSVVYALAYMLLHRFCNRNQSARGASEDAPAGWELSSGACATEDWAAAEAMRPSPPDMAFQNSHASESIAANAQKSIPAEAQRIKKISRIFRITSQVLLISFFYTYILTLSFVDLTNGTHVLRVLLHPLVEGYGAVCFMLSFTVFFSSFSLGLKRIMRQRHDFYMI